MHLTTRAIQHIPAQKGTKRERENREAKKNEPKEEKTAKEEEKKEKQSKNGTHGNNEKKKEGQKRGKEEIFPNGNSHFKCFLPEEKYKKT